MCGGWSGAGIHRAFCLRWKGLRHVAAVRGKRGISIMGFVGNRIRVVSTYLYELWKHGMTPPVPLKKVGLSASEPEVAEGDVIFVLDGVGGFQFAPLLVRRALREIGEPIPTAMYRWQGGLVGEIWTDLMWHSRNRVMGARLARRIRRFRRAHPDRKIHLLAYSGGAGVAVFACEYLKQPSIETMILACPAISPTYNLARALRHVTRAYALTSVRDRFLLGIGTTLFGTTDRVNTPAAGMVGFRLPEDISEEDRLEYDKLRQICWEPSLRQVKHHGGHTGWLMPDVLRSHLIHLLRGEPRLATHEVQAVPVKAAPVGT